MSSSSVVGGIAIANSPLSRRIPSRQALLPGAPGDLDPLHSHRREAPDQLDPMPLGPGFRAPIRGRMQNHPSSASRRRRVARTGIAFLQQASRPPIRSPRAQRAREIQHFLTGEASRSFAPSRAGNCRPSCGKRLFLPTRRGDPMSLGPLRTLRSAQKVDGDFVLCGSAVFQATSNRRGRAPRRSREDRKRVPRPPPRQCSTSSAAMRSTTSESFAPGQSWRRAWTMGRDTTMSPTARRLRIRTRRGSAMDHQAFPARHRSRSRALEELLQRRDDPRDRQFAQAREMIAFVEMAGPARHLLLYQ